MTVREISFLPGVARTNGNSYFRLCFDEQIRDKFQAPLNRLIKYLHQQIKLIAYIGAQCPKVVKTTWISLFNVCKWIIKHRTEVHHYLEKKKLTAAPDSLW